MKGLTQAKIWKLRRCHWSECLSSGTITLAALIINAVRSNPFVIKLTKVQNPKARQVKNFRVVYNLWVSRIVLDQL